MSPKKPAAPTLALPCTPLEFETRVFDTVKQDSLSVIDAYLASLEFFEIEIEDAHRVKTQKLEDKLRLEYQSRNMIQKTSVFDESEFTTS